MSEEFWGQLALVARGTGGLGRAVSLAFLEEGATVVVTYRRQSELEALRQAAGDHAWRLEGHVIDVTNDAAVRQMISAMVANHGRLDAMTNTVGGYAAGSKLWEAEPAMIDQMLALNFYSGYVLCRSVVPAMLKQGRGAIVHVASRAAIDHARRRFCEVAKAARYSRGDSFPLQRRCQADPRRSDSRLASG